MKNMADNAPKVFLDTNILIDYLLFRGEEALAAEYLFDCSFYGKLTICIAPHSLTNIYYILRKEYSPEERNTIIHDLCDLFTVIPVSGDTIVKAVTSGYAADAEDALQIRCAVEGGCDYFLTRDRELFRNSPVKTLLPHELIHELSL